MGFTGEQTAKLEPHPARHKREDLTDTPRIPPAGRLRWERKERK